MLPEEITAQSFRTRWRGYDPAEVKTFLRRVSREYTAVVHRLAALARDSEPATRGADQLAAQLTALADDARTLANQTRQDAEQDAARIRERGQQAAGAILQQAEQAAAAVLGQANRLRAGAEEDVATARREAEEARQRRDSDTAAAQQRRDALRALEGRLAGRLRDTDRALAELRSRVDMLGEVQRLEELIAAIRADTWSEWAEIDGDAKAAEDEAVAPAAP